MERRNDGRVGDGTVTHPFIHSFIQFQTEAALDLLCIAFGLIHGVECVGQGEEGGLDVRRSMGIWKRRVDQRIPVFEFTRLLVGG